MRLAAKPFITELIALLPPCTAALGRPSSLSFQVPKVVPGKQLTLWLIPFGLCMSTHTCLLGSTENLCCGFVFFFFLLSSLSTDFDAFSACRPKPSMLTFLLSFVAVGRF